MDDAARKDEQEIIERWLAEYPSIKHEYKPLERGCTILSIARNDK